MAELLAAFDAHAGKPRADAGSVKPVTGRDPGAYSADIVATLMKDQGDGEALSGYSWSQLQDHPMLRSYDQCRRLRVHGVDYNTSVLARDYAGAAQTVGSTGVWTQSLCRDTYALLWCPVPDAAHRAVVKLDGGPHECWRHSDGGKQSQPNKPPLVLLHPTTFSRAKALVVMVSQASLLFELPKRSPRNSSSKSTRRRGDAGTASPTSHV